MLIDLKANIRKALSGSSSQHPVDASVLVKGRQRRRVEAALMELYQANEVGCCKVTKRGEASTVWWLIGGVSAPHSFGRLCQPKVVVGRVSA